MQCPECGHNVADGRAECIYCGAALGEIAFADDLDSLKKGQITRFSREAGKEGTTCEVIEEHKEYNNINIDDVSGDWRKKIVEAIQRREGDIAPDSSIQEQDIFSFFSHPKTPRRKRLHPLILALFFLRPLVLSGLFCGCSCDIGRLPCENSGEFLEWR